MFALESAQEKDFHRSAGRHLSDPLLFNLFTVVYPHCGVKDHPFLSALSVYNPPCHFGLGYVFRRASPYFYHSVRKRDLSFPPAQGHCREGPFPFYDPDGKVDGGFEGEGTAILH